MIVKCPSSLLPVYSIMQLLNGYVTRYYTYKKAQLTQREARDSLGI